jgi:hypothetical protein
MSTEGWKAFFVREVDKIGVYDIYDETHQWMAQVRFPRRKGDHVYLIVQRQDDKVNELKQLNSRDAWRQWLLRHRGDS